MRKKENSALYLSPYSCRCCIQVYSILEYLKQHSELIEEIAFLKIRLQGEM
jgi:uncharacterized protein YpiB (UPF0302 family)